MRASQLLYGLGLFGVLLNGCGGPGATNNQSAQDDTTVQLDLSQTPPDGRCAIITATPAMGTAVQRQIQLVSGQTSTFTLTGLPTGTVTFSEQVFTQPCNMTAGKTPAYVSNSVTADVEIGVPVALALVLVRNEVSVTISGDFPEPAHPIVEFAVPELGGPSSPGSITAGPDGALWFSIHSAKLAIGRITTAGDITTFLLPATVTSVDPVIAGPDGNIWFGDGANVGRMTLEGLVTEFALPTGGAEAFMNQGPDGNLWGANAAANQIQRITTGGGVTGFTVPTANAGPLTVCAGPDGNMWFTEFTANKIGKLSTGGTFLGEFNVPTAAAQLNEIVAGPDGNLWFTEAAANKVGRSTTAGAIAEFTIPTANSIPTTIVLGADANLWFIESAAASNKIARITPLGTITEFPIPTPAAGAVWSTAGADGNIWFTESNTGKVARIKP
jgi:virginiamycin B lyase